ncbi:MAG: hypothetical protein JNL98_27015 [Bryobacterales bacterium]|nr:hypothetical protein [Bryobacterales bacterium]
MSVSVRWIALTPLLVQAALQAQPNQNKVIFTLPQAVNSRPQFSIATKDVDPIRAGADFSAVAGNNASFDRISDGLLRPFNIGIATQLSALPIASPASGVIFKEDPATGASLPDTQSLGPILTERAETIGRGRLFAGFTRQQFRFNNLEGQSLKSIRALDRGGVATRVYQDGVRQTTSPTTIDTEIDVRLDQNIAVFTYGLTNRIDVTGALTWVHSSASVTASNAQIYNTGNPFEKGTCWCAQTFDIEASRASFAQDYGRSGFRINGAFGSARRSANGLGDTLIRVKGTVMEGRTSALALGADLRLPTGDELNYHGSGAVGFKPFAAYSLHARDLGPVRVSPHFNVGFQFNGKSVLAGDPVTGAKEKLPNMFNWSAGAGISAGSRVTFLADILGMTLVNSFRLTEERLDARGEGIAAASGVTLAPNKQTFAMHNGAFGVKLKLAGNMVFSTNFMVALDNNGLRDRVVPLFGIGYTF